MRVEPWNQKLLEPLAGGLAPLHRPYLVRKHAKVNFQLTSWSLLARAWFSLFQPTQIHSKNFICQKKSQSQRSLTKAAQFLTTTKGHSIPSLRSTAQLLQPALDGARVAIASSRSHVGFWIELLCCLMIDLFSVAFQRARSLLRQNGSQDKLKSVSRAPKYCHWKLPTSKRRVQMEFARPECESWINSLQTCPN